jgi:SAM-dependent methyltransferase
VDAEEIRVQSRLQAEGWWFRGRSEIIRSLLPAPAGDAFLLDVGCGWGGIAAELSPWGRVLGVDASEAARAEASHRGVDVIAGSAESIPVEDGSADIVLCADVLEHLDDDAAAAREMRRVLKPDGIALVTVPAYPRLFGAHDRALEHRRRYTKRTLLAALEAGGLAVDRVTHFNALLLPIAFPARLMQRGRPAAADAGRQQAGRMNEMLYWVFRSERGLVRRFNLPAGLSIAALARPARGS